MICNLFQQIIGFKDKKESDFFRINNTERDWSEYTTIGLGIEFARRNFYNLLLFFRKNLKIFILFVA